MLIHARGCTAVKLIRVAQRNGIEVVLVQSDPDMDSTSVDMLTERDRVVCIGGNTPDESYLNAMSVLRVAEHEGVDSLHPGIGFLSENSQFAELCRSHGINFIGPPVASMEAMGNKSNAINTALRLDVPVVPGSHGILTNVERAAEVANADRLSGADQGGARRRRQGHPGRRFAGRFPRICSIASSSKRARRSATATCISKNT